MDGTVNADQVQLNVAARKTARELLDLVVGECAGRPPAFAARLWEILRDKAIEQVGMPPCAGQAVKPLTEEEAREFAETPMPFGKHRGLALAEIDTRHPEYLAMLVDDSDFIKMLRRYLERTKYRHVEQD